jgi:hypothetical protein
VFLEPRFANDARAAVAVTVQTMGNRDILERDIDATEQQGVNIEYARHGHAGIMLNDGVGRRAGTGDGDSEVPVGAELKFAEGEVVGARRNVDGMRTRRAIGGIHRGAQR